MTFKILNNTLTVVEESETYITLQGYVQIRNPNWEGLHLSVFTTYLPLCNIVLNFWVSA